MEDDIFSQLANLIENKPTYSNVSSGLGSSILKGNNDQNSSDSQRGMFAQDDIVVPVIKPKKVAREKKLILTLDDDFSTLDLMKIYLQRDYEYVSFDNPKNAIFYLNSNIPDLIFIDCYLNVMKTKRVVDIIRTYKELANVPIIYLAEQSELYALKNKLPDGVLDIISRPVKRGDLQRILDLYVLSREDENDDDGTPIDHPIM